MAEPLPSASTEADETSPLPTNAEDRRAAAALNALDANALQSDSTQTAKPPSQFDQDALGKAMSRLEMVAGGNKKDDGSEEKKETKGEEKKRREEEETKRKKAVKVKAEDVTLLVEELELSKAKATDLLKSYEGDAVKALRAYITPVAVKV